MILPSQTIRHLCSGAYGQRPMVMPFCERTKAFGMSFGLSAAGYDVRIAQTIIIQPQEYVLVSTVEKFAIPTDILASVADKSTWARRGLTVQNTIIEPGWRGYLTLELANHCASPITISSGTPIAQIIFYRLEAPTEQPYTGKYQDQENGAVEARFEQD